MFKNAPRMLLWCVLTVALMAVSLWVQSRAPGSVLTVTLYKAHLMALGGWGGYWLDRALFPYDRPHQYLEEPAEEPTPLIGVDAGVSLSAEWGAFGNATMRRAIIVAACLVCVGLGA